MRPQRDFRPQQLYAITQRGNQGQWVYRDAEDFTKALDLIRKYATLHEVAVHGWCLLHNHGHWIFEASTPDSISNLMRDMQSRYSHYLNTKYKATPWLLIAPLYGCRDLDHFSPYLRMGPVNWTPRYHAEHLDAAGFQAFLRYVENNPVRAGRARRAVDWLWSSAQAHCTGVDKDNLLCIDRWQHLFGNPETIAREWQSFLEDRIAFDRTNFAKECQLGTGSRHNRPHLTAGALTGALTGPAPPGT